MLPVGIIAAKNIQKFIQNIYASPPRYLSHRFRSSFINSLVREYSNKIYAKKLHHFSGVNYRIEDFNTQIFPERIK